MIWHRCKAESFGKEVEWNNISYLWGPETHCSSPSLLWGQVPESIGGVPCSCYHSAHVIQGAHCEGGDQTESLEWTTRPHGLMCGNNNHDGNINTEVVGKIPVLRRDFVALAPSWLILSILPAPTVVGFCRGGHWELRAPKLSFLRNDVSFRVRMRGEDHLDTWEQTA